MLIQARGKGDMPETVEVAGGRPPEAVPFRVEVNGESGDSVLEGRAMRAAQPAGVSLHAEAPPALFPHVRQADPYCADIPTFHLIRGTLG